VRASSRAERGDVRTTLAGPRPACRIHPARVVAGAAVEGISVEVGAGASAQREVRGADAGAVHALGFCGASVAALTAVGCVAADVGALDAGRALAFGGALAPTGDAQTGAAIEL